ncbi:MAG: 5-(carboxyamino)imidazole ribonucleotide synthase [Planctomycetota bacterium]
MQPIYPPATLGMLGGGQLGRMFAIAAAQMGYHVHVYEASAECPAAQVADQVFVGAWDDHDALQTFAATCDVITLEFENIPVDALHRCQEQTPTFPGPNVLAVAQDRDLEKSTLRDAGLPVTPFVVADTVAQLRDAMPTIGFPNHPAIVKTTRNGYDGKGQWGIHSLEDLDAVIDADHPSIYRLIAERKIEFECEVSVMVSISTSGEIATFPVFQNDHQNHILHISRCPARLPQRVLTAATETACQAAQALGVVGMFCIEFFVLGKSLESEFGCPVMINEVAPRPHNSGHLTIEGNVTSQFQQQVRAVCGLALGDTSLIRPTAMLNLLGDQFDADAGLLDPQKFLSISNGHLHLYGKTTAKPGRKMGHFTVSADSMDECDRSLNTLL